MCKIKCKSNFKMHFICAYDIKRKEIPECLFNFVKKFSDLPGYFRSVSK